VNRLPQRRESSLAGLQPRLDARLCGLLGVHAGRAQLKQCTGRGAGQLGPVPYPGRYGEHRCLVRLQPDVGQLVGLPGNPVADLVVKRRVGTHIERDAKLAEFLLVPLEHALERVEGFRVTGHRGADLGGGQVALGGEQADHQAEQPLGLPP
jgi:hypothetical protein